MKKIVVILGCVAILLAACGEDSNEQQNTVANQTAQQSEQVSANNAADANASFSQVVGNDADKFFAEFDKFSPAQKYYFCAAFAMGAMSVSKPVTASAMVNYFMGLGVAKYDVGINDDTYKAFNAGKNTFLHENLVNAILKRKVCENIMNEAADFARDRNYNVADLDKRGKKEVEKVVGYIKKENADKAE